MPDMRNTYILHREIEKMVEADDSNRLLEFIIYENQFTRVNEENSDFQTPLLIAAHKGLMGVTQFLLNHKASIKQYDAKHNTSLHIAVEKGFAGVVSILLENDAPTDFQNLEGLTPLHIAARDGKEAITILLLERKAKNSPGPNKYTPLHYACMNCRLKTIQIMLGYSPLENVHSVASDDKTALWLLIAKMQGYIISDEDKDKKIQFKFAIKKAIRQNNLMLLKVLMNFHELFDSDDNNRLSLNTMSQFLVYACSDGNIQAAKIFLNLGADADGATGSPMLTPLNAALQEGDEELMDCLIFSGASVFKRQETDSKTSLHYAVTRSEINFAEKLLKKGVNPNVKDKYKKTPLFYVRNLPMAELLLEYGADVSVEMLTHFSSHDYYSVFGYGICELLKKTIVATNVASMYIRKRLVVPVKMDEWSESKEIPDYWKSFELKCKYEFCRLLELRYGQFELAIDLFQENTRKWKKCNRIDDIYLHLYSESFHKRNPIYTRLFRSKYWIIKCKTGVGSEPPENGRYTVESPFLPPRRVPSTSSSYF